MKKAVISLMSIALIAGLSGCSSQTKSENSMYQASSYDGKAYAYTNAAEAGDYVDFDDFYLYTNDDGSIGYNDAIPTSMSNEPEYKSKIIRNARINLSAKDVKKAYADYLEFIKQNGGYEFYYDFSANDYYTSISATLKIKPDNLDTAVAYANECGDVTNSATSSEDITSNYYDAKIRLENKKQNLEKYYDYLKNASTMEEIIQIQTQIDIITSDIESYEGQLRVWDSLTNESTIILNITQENDPDAIQEEFDWHTMTAEKMGRYMTNGLKKTCNTLVSILQWLIIAVFTLFPVIIIVGVIIFIIVKAKKAKKLKKQQEISISNLENNVSDKEMNISLANIDDTNERNSDGNTPNPKRKK